MSTSNAALLMSLTIIFLKFDMAVDGLSYFSMPAVFELGKYQTHVLLTDGCIQS